MRVELNQVKTTEGLRTGDILQTTFRNGSTIDYLIAASHSNFDDTTYTLVNMSSNCIMYSVSVKDSPDKLIEKMKKTFKSAGVQEVNVIKESEYKVVRV